MTTYLHKCRGKRGIKEHGVLRNALRNIFILAHQMAMSMSLGSKKLAEIFLHTYKPHWKCFLTRGLKLENDSLNASITRWSDPSPDGHHLLTAERQ